MLQMRAPAPNVAPQTPTRTLSPMRGLLASLSRLAHLRTERRRIDAFIARHELAWDLAVAALALLYLLIGFVEDHPLGVWDERLLAPIEVGITVIFLLEFTLRLYA